MVFLLAGITALAFARLGLVATGAAVDWRRNPAWLALLLLLLGGDGGARDRRVVAAGPFIVMGLGAILTPLLVVGFFVGFDRRAFGILMLSVVGHRGAGGPAPVLRVAQHGPARRGAGGRRAHRPGERAAATPVALGVLGIVLGVAIIAVLVLARLWLRRPHDEEAEVPETREIDRGEWDSDVRGPRRRGRFARRPEPKDAAARLPGAARGPRGAPGAPARARGDARGARRAAAKRRGPASSRSTCWPRTTASRGSARWTSRPRSTGAGWRGQRRCAGG